MDSFAWHVQTFLAVSLFDRRTMRMLWCWRCKAEMPMLDDDEFHLVSSLFNTGTEGGTRERMFATALRDMSASLVSTKQIQTFCITIVCLCTARRAGIAESPSEHQKQGCVGRACTPGARDRQATDSKVKRDGNAHGAAAYTFHGYLSQGQNAIDALHSTIGGHRASAAKRSEREPNRYAATGAYWNSNPRIASLDLSIRPCDPAECRATLSGFQGKRISENAARRGPGSHGHTTMIRLSLDTRHQPLPDASKTGARCGIWPTSAQPRNEITRYLGS
jgi:hypothetical protein